VEKPVYYEKQVIVENREEIDVLRQRINVLERTNQELYIELNNSKNKPS